MRPRWSSRPRRQAARRPGPEPAAGPAPDRVGAGARFGRKFSCALRVTRGVAISHRVAWACCGTVRSARAGRSAAAAPPGLLPPVSSAGRVQPRQYRRDPGGQGDVPGSAIGQDECGCGDGQDADHHGDVREQAASVAVPGRLLFGHREEPFIGTRCPFFAAATSPLRSRRRQRW